jgi:hypothetical protein
VRLRYSRFGKKNNSIRSCHRLPGEAPRKPQTHKEGIMMLRSLAAAMLTVGLVFPATAQVGACRSPPPRRRRDRHGLSWRVVSGCTGSRE